MKAFDKIDRLIAWVCKAIVFATFIIILVSGSIQVFYRFILDKSFSWTDELCRYGMVWMTFVGAGYAVRTHQHIAVDLLKNYIPKKIGDVLDRINCAFILFFSAVLTYYGGRLAAMNISQVSPGLKLSLGFVYSCVPICGFLCLIYAAADMLGWIPPEKREENEEGN